MGQKLWEKNVQVNAEIDRYASLRSQELKANSVVYEALNRIETIGF